MTMANLPLDNSTPRNYAEALRRLPYGQIELLISGVREIEPGLGDQPVFALKPAPGFADMAANLGINFRTSALTGSGLNLFGFYAPNHLDGLRRPCIWLNSAHDPLAIWGSFHHEVAYHLMQNQVKEPGRRTRPGSHWFIGGEFEEHLDDPSEMAADIAVSLSFYPLPVALKLFPRRSIPASADCYLEPAALARIFEYLKATYGFDLRNVLRQPALSHYLSGVIHYIRLRQALAKEYAL
jgi:hypothetical protein